MRFNEISKQLVLTEMQLRTAPIKKGSLISSDTLIVAHRDSIWVIDDQEWKNNKKQITAEISQSIGLDDEDAEKLQKTAIWGRSALEDLLNDNKNVLVFSMVGDSLTHQRNTFGQSPQTSPLFKKVAKFLLNNFDLTTEQMRIFAPGVSQRGFTKDKVDSADVKGSLPTVGYHGTNIDRVVSIIKKGIMPQASGNYGDVHTPGYVFFAADDSSLTQKYASHAAGGIWDPKSIPVTVHFKIPDQNLIKPDVDIAHDIYDKDAAKINPDYANLNFPKKEKSFRSTKGVKRPEKMWQHAEVFGYKGRIPPTHIVGFSVPQKIGGPSISVEQMIENIKAWNILKEKYSAKDILQTSEVSWQGKSAAEIVDAETKELSKPKNELD